MWQDELWNSTKEKNSRATITDSVVHVCGLRPGVVRFTARCQQILQKHSKASRWERARSFFSPSTKAGSAVEASANARRWDANARLLGNAHTHTSRRARTRPAQRAAQSDLSAQWRRENGGQTMELFGIWIKPDDMRLNGRICPPPPPLAMVEDVTAPKVQQISVIIQAANQWNPG